MSIKKTAADAPSSGVLSCHGSCYPDLMQGCFSVTWLLLALALMWHVFMLVSHFPWALAIPSGRKLWMLSVLRPHSALVSNLSSTCLQRSSRCSARKISGLSPTCFPMSSGCSECSGLMISHFSPTCLPAMDAPSSVPALFYTCLPFISNLFSSKLWMLTAEMVETSTERRRTPVTQRANKFYSIYGIYIYIFTFCALKINVFMRSCCILFLL